MSLMLEQAQKEQMQDTVGRAHISRIFKRGNC